jgi:protein subunit release factor B
MLHAFDPKTIQRMSFEEPAAVQEKQQQERQQQKQEKQQQEKQKKKKSAREQLDTTSLTKPTKGKFEVGIFGDKRH